MPQKKKSLDGPALRLAASSVLGCHCLTSLSYDVTEARDQPEHGVAVAHQG